MKSVGSSSGGAVRKANYMAGENNEPSEALKQSHYNAGKKIGNTDYSYKNDEVLIDGIVSPFKGHWANSYDLWKSVEERDTRKIYTRKIEKDGETIEQEQGYELAKNIICHIPHQIIEAGRGEALLKGFALKIKDDHGVPVHYVAHQPSGINRTVESELNYHSHILIGCRGISKDGKWDKRKAEFTTGNRSEILKDWREEWAERINAELERLGEDERVDHRSFEDRGIQYYHPMRHEGVGGARNQSAVIHNAREMVFRSEFDRARSELGEDADENTLNALASNLRAEIAKIPVARIKANLRKARTQITKNLKFRNPDNIIITTIEDHKNDNIEIGTRKNNLKEGKDISTEDPKPQRFGSEIQKADEETRSRTQRHGEYIRGIGEIKTGIEGSRGRVDSEIQSSSERVSEAIRSALRTYDERDQSLWDGLGSAGDQTLDNDRRWNADEHQRIQDDRLGHPKHSDIRSRIARLEAKIGRRNWSAVADESATSIEPISVLPQKNEVIPGELKKEVGIPVQTPEQAQELPLKKEKKKFLNPFKKLYNAVDKVLDWMVDRLNAIFYPPKKEAEEKIDLENIGFHAGLNEREMVLEGVEHSNPKSDPDLSPDLEEELNAQERDFEIIEQAEEAERLFLALDKSIEANAKAKADPMKKILNRIEDEEAKGLFDDLNDAIEKNVKAKVKEKEQSKEQSKGISR